MLFRVVVWGCLNQILATTDETSFNCSRSFLRSHGPFAVAFFSFNNTAHPQGLHHLRLLFRFLFLFLVPVPPRAVSFIAYFIIVRPDTCVIMLSLWVFSCFLPAVTSTAMYVIVITLTVKSNKNEVHAPRLYGGRFARGGRLDRVSNEGTSDPSILSIPFCCHLKAERGPLLLGLCIHQINH